MLVSRTNLLDTVNLVLKWICFSILGFLGICAAIIIVSMVSCEISNQIEARKEIKRQYGWLSPFDVLANKQLFAGGEGYGCTYMVVRFGQENADTIMSEGLKAFPQMQGLGPSPAEFDYGLNPERCFDELSDDLTAEIRSAVKNEGSWVSYYRYGESGNVRVVDPVRRIAAQFRLGD